MKKINIAFGIHNHQPVGNFDFVFEEAYTRSYLPFLELLEQHPKMRIAQHYTGILFQWLLQHKPEFMPRLRRLVESGQVEMMTGGFYEPIMSVIPDRDKAGQIGKLTDFIVRHTGYKPEGMWLAERIWEPHLPKPFADAGVHYVVLDDSHFKNAGLKEEELLGYFITEEQGRPVFLFPVSERLRYTIPFQPPEKTIDYLSSIANEEGDALVVFADDGEKFGIWPGTYEHCYENGWLEQFFSLLEENSDWINIIHPSEAVAHLRPSGRIYLPTASYREMMEWAMPTDAIHQYDQFEETLKEQSLHDRFKVFVRGGFWRNFMVKYPESNNMHKKMLYLSGRLSEMEADFGATDAFKAAQDHVWAGQCNCPYWHGVFGGLYLNHLRYATYNQFIQAERLLDELQSKTTGRGDVWIEAEVADFDSDGYEEILISTGLLNAYVSPEQGGSLFELDFKPRGINLLDTMTRREESYHRKLIEATRPESEKGHDQEEEGAIASIHDIVVMKEEGLEQLLAYDWYRRTCFIDHFLADGTTLEAFSKTDYDEVGDFVGTRFASEVERGEGGVRLALRRQGKVMCNGEKVPILLQKDIEVRAAGSELRVEYKIQNSSTQVAELWFGTELDFSLLAGDAADRYFVFPGRKIDDPRLRSSGIVQGTEVRLVDEWLRLAVNVSVDIEAGFWRFPIETVSQSEGGFERVYQSSVILPNWKFVLQPGKIWATTVTVRLEAL